MREIGCKVFVLIQNRHNPKIYERSVECVLIGYETNAKSYRCYHRATRQVISSYHVRFLESHDGHPLPSPAIHTHRPNSPPQTQPFTLDNMMNPATTIPAELEDDEDSDPKDRTIGE